MNDKEKRELIVQAFRTSQFKWRTPRGIAKDTKLPFPEVLEFLDRSDVVRKAKKGNKYGDPLYTLEERYERGRPFLEKVVSRIINQD